MGTSEEKHQMPTDIFFYVTSNGVLRLMPYGDDTIVISVSDNFYGYGQIEVPKEKVKELIEKLRETL